MKTNDNYDAPLVPGRDLISGPFSGDREADLKDESKHKFKSKEFRGFIESQPTRAMQIYCLATLDKNET